LLLSGEACVIPAIALAGHVIGCLRTGVAHPMDGSNQFIPYLDFKFMSGKIYVGLDNDDFGGMTPIGNVIRDAWMFDLLPDTENCENWSYDRLRALHDQVMTEWDKHGCLVSNLPDDLKQRHKEINDKALKIARERGWKAAMVAD
jgi:hypothetical protein